MQRCLAGALRMCALSQPRRASGQAAVEAATASPVHQKGSTDSRSLAASADIQHAVLTFSIAAQAACELHQACWLLLCSADVCRSAGGMRAALGALTIGVQC